MRFFEKEWYNPSFLHWSMAFLFLPFSLLYCAVASLKKIACKPKSFGIPLVSVGNLIVGGSGKTPIVIELAKRYENAAVVLRGYKRTSKGTIVVSTRGKISCNVEESGDEAMLLAKSLPFATIIVSENRDKGIQKAKELGCKVVFLDDAFHKCYEKFDILIDIEGKNRLCLPSGPYRLPRFFLLQADIVIKENQDFTRRVTITNPTEKMVLVTAIANPDRLKRFIPKNIPTYYFCDHHSFTKEELEEIVQKEHPTSLLVTRKDVVKLQKFHYNYSILELKIDIDEKVIDRVDRYIKDFYAKKDSNGSNPS